MAREIEKWITINGVHIPVYKGDNVKTAIKRNIDKFNTPSNKKSDDDVKKEQIIKNKEQANKASGKDSFIVHYTESDLKEIDKYNKAKRDKYWNRVTGRAYEENDKWTKYELPNNSNSKDSKDYVKDKIKEVTGYDNIKMRLGPWSKSSNIYEYYYEEKKIAEFRQGYGKPRGTLKIFKK